MAEDVTVNPMAVRYRMLSILQIPDLPGEKAIRSAFKQFDPSQIMLAVLGAEPIQTSAGDHDHDPYDAYADFDPNQQLAPLGATRTLLQEVALAAESFQRSLEGSLTILSEHETYSESSSTLSSPSTVTKRRLKTAWRVVRCSDIVVTFYSFALFVATISIREHTATTRIEEPATPSHLTPSRERPNLATIAEAVRRSRMVVSTVDTFLGSNLDRAMKPIAEYTKSKAVRAILQSVGEHARPD